MTKKIKKESNELPFDTSLIHKNTRKEASDKEKLVFLFKTLINKGERYYNFFNGNDIVIKFDDLIKSPYFFEDTIENDLSHLITYVQEDKDFYRKNNFFDYKIDFEYYDELKSEFGFKFFLFKDFTDDFMNTYLHSKLGVKNSSTDKKSNYVNEYYKIGKFEYKNNDLFFNDERIKLSPQELIIMRKFMYDQELGSKYYSYDDICDFISIKNQVSKDNMQKIISKLRRNIIKKTKDFSIEGKSGIGYIFSIKNIR